MSAAPNLNDNWYELVKEISQVITHLTGNVMEDKQRPMIESRLKRRSLDLKMTTAREYRDYWKQHQEAENKVLIGLLTTHFTSFFREFMHFEWIARELPAIVSEVRAQGRKTIRIWSAAASKGQEVWSLCMWLEHHLPQIDPEMSWTVLGSDIDEVSIKEAQNGVYHRRELETAPRHLWEGHWVRGKAEISDWYKIKSTLKNHAEFKVMNLLDLKLPPDEKFDIILSRNVLIYFDRENQKKIVASLLSHLSRGGTLITGLSESLGGFGLPVKGVAPSVYKLQSATDVVSPAVAVRKTEELPFPMKVLCVDDSGTILTMFKKILAPPQFEIIGVASNGLEAIEKLKSLKPDVITLDIHMPEMDGLSFLKSSGVASRIPVVIVSSVGRDHEPLINPLRELGVVDFVEKPTLSNMNKIGEELMQKLKLGWLNRKKTIESPFSLSAHSAARPEGVMVFNFGSGDEEKLFRNLAEESWEKDHLIFRYAGEEFPAQLKHRILERIPKNQRRDFVRSGEALNYNDKTLVWICYQKGESSKLTTLRKKQDFLIVEEGSPGQLLFQASDVSPSTSFSYLVTKFLRGE